jgi:hypothetical protein
MYVRLPNYHVKLTEHAQVVFAANRFDTWQILNGSMKLLLHSSTDLQLRNGISTQKAGRNQLLYRH